MQQPLEPKIIGLGFQKTGTSSLRDALRLLGYRVGDTKPRLLLPILRENWAAVSRQLRRYDAVEDNPWPLIYRQLDKMAPGSKFILTIREEESWYHSVSRHIGDLRAPLHEWIYGRGKGLPRDDRENTLNVYRQHNRDVQRYFADRPDDLLVMDIADGHGWEPLCRFLDRPIPENPFPHANNSAAPVRKKRGALHSFVKKYRKRARFALMCRLYDVLGYNGWNRASGTLPFPLQALDTHE